MSDNNSVRPVRVMILVSGLDIGKAHGGAERFGIELARHLDPERYSVLLCAFWRRHTHTESHWVDQLNSSGVRITFASDWPGRFNLRSYLQGALKLSHELESEPVEILHSHYQMGTLAALYLRSRKRTRIAIRTAHVSKEWGSGLRSWIARSILTDWVYPLTLDAEIGVSQSIVRTLNGHPGSILGRKTPLLIHNAIYPESFQAAPTIFPNPDENPLKEQYIVGSVGRFTLQKGFYYLINSIPIINLEVPNTRYLLVGDGELRQSLEVLAESLGVANQIEFVGQQPDGISFIKKMDLFVLPSLYEGLPTVIMESMACGIPVIATNVPGTDELIQDGLNGWLVPPKQPQTLAQAILFALHNPKARESIARRALESVMSFHIDKITAEYEALYQRLSKGCSIR